MGPHIHVLAVARRAEEATNRWRASVRSEVGWPCVPMPLSAGPKHSSVMAAVGWVGPTLLLCANVRVALGHCDECAELAVHLTRRYAERARCYPVHLLLPVLVDDCPLKPVDRTR